MLLIRSFRPLVVTAACATMLQVAAQGTLAVELSLPRHGDGPVMVAVCPDAASFTTDQGCIQRMEKAVRPVTTVRFPGLPAGRYAVKAFLDLNGNATLDHGDLGLPVEPVGFSNDVLGKPSAVLFGKAAVEVPAEGAVLRLRLRGRPPTTPAR